MEGNELIVLVRYTDAYIRLVVSGVETNGGAFGIDCWCYNMMRWGLNSTTTASSTGYSLLSDLVSSVLWLACGCYS